jgi:2,4-dienoyl-CoA reductase-like NADH-dependent reductase (Old Yellow Enzyme family)
MARAGGGALKYSSPGQQRSFADFRAHWRALAPELDADEHVHGAEGALGRSIQVAGRSLSNRFAVHPMEGWDALPDGLPSEHTQRRWRNFGRSGAKLIWGGEAFAVLADGRANPNQLYLQKESARGLDALVSALREGHREIGENPEELCFGLQLTHSGRFARPSEKAPRIAWHEPELDAHFGIGPQLEPLSDAELQDIAEHYIRAAVMARDAGFQFVDVKCCHGYLMHELLGATGRAGRYGGVFENRTRLLREIITGIRAACPGLEIGVRISIADLAPHRANPKTGIGEARTAPSTAARENQPLGLDLSEGLRVLKLLRELGVVLINVTLGSPYYCPHLQRPAAYPPSDGYLPPRDPLLEVATHLRAVRACRAAVPGLVLVGTGYSYLQQWLAHVAQHEIAAGHVDFVGLGRMVLSYPEFALDVLRGRSLERKRICRTFSDCTSAPRNGLLSGCYPLDPYYKALPDFERLAAVKAKLRES